MKIEGKNAVSELLKSGKDVDVLLVEKGTEHPIIAMARERGVKIQFVDRYILDKESMTGKHQGFIARVSGFEYCGLEDIMEEAEARNEKPFIVVLDGIEDPHNLGSILRVCECGGVHGVVIGKNRAAAVTETVIRVSAGAAEHMKVARVTNINSAVQWFQQNKIWVYGADMKGESVYKTDLTGAVALVIGGEGKGLGKLTGKLCDGTVSLPIRGKVNSLNASVACGVLVYEALRQRMGL